MLSSFLCVYCLLALCSCARFLAFSKGLCVAYDLLSSVHDLLAVEEQRKFNMFDVPRKSTGNLVCVKRLN